MKSDVLVLMLVQDIEESFVLGADAMPIDLDIDHDNARLYWTDRALGTVHRAGLEIPAGETAMNPETRRR